MSEKGDNIVPMPSAMIRGACPLCGKPTKAETRPFCSRRCADRDLGNWFNESYYVPGDEVVDPENAPEIERDDEA
ncbi:MAG: DNA gyrase inhibitor YacG [Rhodospirillales bacterium]